MFKGWSEGNSSLADSTVLKDVTDDLVVYACFSKVELDPNQDIFDAIEDGSYRDWDIGQKTIDVEIDGIGTVPFELVAVDTDELSDGSGTAATTWVTKVSLRNRDCHTWNIGLSNAGGYVNSELKRHLEKEIFTALPENLQNQILPVKKSYRLGSGNSGITEEIALQIWPLSSYELSVDDVASGWSAEVYGVKYPKLYSNRIKNSLDGYNNVSYWTRTAYYGTNTLAVRINGSGGFDTFNTNAPLYLIFGFCLGKSAPKPQWPVSWYNVDGSLLRIDMVSEGDIPSYGKNPVCPYGSSYAFAGWSPTVEAVTGPVSYYATYSFPTGWGIDITVDEVLKKLDNGTYTDIPLGSRMVVSFGSYGFACMQLVGVNADAGAKTSWVSTTILDATTQWNDLNITKGGWPESKIRTYCQTVFNSLQADVKARVGTVTKYSYVAAPSINKNATSNDQLWIPNYREMNFPGTDLETLGPCYSSVYTDNNARIRLNSSGTAFITWLRSAADGSAGVVSTDGSINAYDASSFYGVCPGFCLS